MKEHSFTLLMEPTRVLMCSCGWSFHCPTNVDGMELATWHLNCPTTHGSIVSREPDGYVAGCTCGWKDPSDWTSYQIAAVEANAHSRRQNEILMHQARENATGITYREEFERIKKSYAT